MSLFPFSLLAPFEDFFSSQRRKSSAKSVALLFPWICCLSLLYPSLSLTLGAQAQERKRTRFGNWEVRCETPTGAPRQQCALVQSVVATDRANVNLVVIALKSPDGKSKILRIVVPLGTLLPTGLQLKLDAAYLGKTGFTRCIPTGCVAEVTMDEKFLAQFQSSTTAIFIIHQVPDQGIGVPVPLVGFKEGFAAL